MLIYHLSCHWSYCAVFKNCCIWYYSICYISIFSFALHTKIESALNHHLDSISQYITGILFVRVEKNQPQMFWDKLKAYISQISWRHLSSQLWCFQVDTEQEHSWMWPNVWQFHEKHFKRKKKILSNFIQSLYSWLLSKAVHDHLLLSLKSLYLIMIPGCRIAHYCIREHYELETFTQTPW